MSGWGFLSKAEGFLDRVLEEQSREKSEPKKVPSSTVGTKVDTPARVSTPTNRWQDRLTRAATQFASTESLPTIAQVRSSFDGQGETKVSTTVSDSTHVAASLNGTTAPIAPKEVEIRMDPIDDALTELQMSKVFPGNMPSYIESIPATDLVVPSPAIEVTNGRSSFQSLRSVESVNKASSAKTSSEIGRSATPIVNTSKMPDTSSMSQADLMILVKSLNEDLQACESRRIEEHQTNTERISALERRLSYFSDDSMTKARQLSSVSGATAQDKLLAEKDARIALLLEEGDNLSKKELQTLANMKKSRTRVAELEGLIATSLKAVEKADAESTANKRDIKAVQDSLTRAESKVKDLTRYEVQVGDLKAEKQVQARVISDLKRQLADADDTIAQNVTIWTQLQAEKNKTDNLQKQIGTLLTEAKLTAEENASDMAEMQGKFDRLTERSRITEVEKAADIARLESELENLRATLEESTTNASENAQAKLLRQIEGLQTQQALARQNWARIEESLVLRSKHAEKERDELREQEDEMRARLRKAALQRKDVEEERSAAYSQAKAHENTIRDLRDQIETLVRQVSEVQLVLESERQSWSLEREMLSTSLETRVQERLIEERQSLQASTPQSPFLQDKAGRSGYAFQRHIPDSPNTSRTPDKRPGMASRGPTQNSRVPFRRKTSQYSVVEGMRSPILGGGQDDEYSIAEDFSSQLRQHTEQSISTTSAGASVGMMERVSSTVRKLEIEMGILREDLVRVTRQRDEARNECVSLESIERDRNGLQRALEDQKLSQQKLENKFEATLELLGEQTEENEQLREDIVDMRKAFKETLLGAGMG